VATLFAVVAACALPPAPPGEPAPPTGRAYLGLQATTFAALNGWKGDDQAAALAVFMNSCGKLNAKPPAEKAGTLPEMGRYSDWQEICAQAALVRAGNETEAQYFFETRFTPYRAIDGSINEGVFVPYGVVSKRTTQGLFTGYYEPELRGAFRPDTRFRHPIYGRPRDLISVDLGRFRAEWKGRQIAGRVEGGQLQPYATRTDIDLGVLKGRQLELLWVDDAIDAFFLHVQGSGRVVMPDGSVVRLGYAGRNGHRYTPIGRELVAMGALPADKVSLKTISDWLRANPLAGNEIMARNRSYIFFRVVEGDGPVGAQGVVLTAGRSLAVDRKFVPLGVPLWLDTDEPGASDKPLRRLVVAQDTGSAIKGPIRGDLFFGFGAAAGARAGEMKEKGGYFLLLPKREQP